jgi:chemotaxis protein methyltransferase CheR
MVDMSVMGMSESTLWPLVRQRLRALCGLVLEDDQSYLLGRLEPVARSFGFPSVPVYLKATLAGGRDDLESALVESMTTHESSFFRDPSFWETLRSRIAPSLASLGRPIQIWSAACSTGQEPYSIAMLLLSHFPGMPFDIWATDIAQDTLARAAAGTFSRVEVDRGLTPQILQKYFEPISGGFRAVEAIRRPIRFDAYNLLGAAHPLRRFDIVCCRNVLVYFDDPSRERVMRRLLDALTPGGWLGLGATELPVKETAGLRRVQDGAGWLEWAR